MKARDYLQIGLSMLKSNCQHKTTMTRVNEAKQLLKLSCEFGKGMGHEKAMTNAKETVIADEFNKVWKGAAYEPSTNCAEKGIDLVDKSGIYPSIQDKGTVSKNKTFALGNRTTWDEVARKALAVDPNALMSFACWDDGEITDHIYGPAKLLLGLRTKEGKLDRNVNPKKLYKLGFTDLG